MQTKNKPSFQTYWIKIAHSSSIRIKNKASFQPYQIKKQTVGSWNGRFNTVKSISGRNYSIG
jgi:hypothetical protein